MMDEDVSILIATIPDVDAGIIERMIDSEIGSVHVSTVPSSLADDFERVKPGILILAYPDISMAERSYLGIYKFGSNIHDMPHRTIVLSSQEGVENAFQLCKEDYFDDYVMFWPQIPDPRRLALAIHRAIRDLKQQTTRPANAAMAREAKRVTGLGPILERHLGQLTYDNTALSNSINRAESDLLLALDAMLARLSNGDLALDDQGTANVNQAIEGLKSGVLERAIANLRSTVPDFQLQSDTVNREVAPHMASLRALDAMGKNLQQKIMVVDDDVLQCKVLAQLLNEEKFDAQYATSATRALTLSQRERPDLYLIDVLMPLVDGVELVRRLQSSESFRDIPIVMITAKGSKKIVVECCEAGAKDFVLKPIRKDVLLKKVRKYLPAL